MSPVIIRQRLHNYLETAGDEKLKAIYTLVEDDMEEQASHYTKEFLKELDDRYNEYKNDPTTAIPGEEVRARAQKILDAAKR